MEQSGHAAEIDQRPIDAARQRASELHGQIAGMIEHLTQQLKVLLEELRTVADPEAAQLQIEAVTSEAAEQVATAVARASRAEQAQQYAEAERAEADAAAEDASALSEQLRTGLEEARQRLTQAETERDRLNAELIIVEARLVEAHGDRDAAVRRAETAIIAQSEAEARSRNAVERADAESARAARAEDAVESVRRGLAQADQQVAELRDEVSDLRGKLAAMTAQRDAAVHDAEREKTHGYQRVDDLRARHEEENRRVREELAESRGELNTARDETLVQRSRADRAEARLDNALTTKARRPQSPAGRARRRGDIAATGTEETRD
ncbi:hypothetical protein FHU33_3219 [Blastococcus colisei]|uniref:Uncharacterized protein n=1 Tax=Blastococcus colisei TaxID=1564162 RepID=A0A543PI62_9ACTN|nr:hypothetical protein [Blastococcus colisei]TQN43755.1 hypothetical protein FHU33_3219 [Blastococcus colisei]